MYPALERLRGQLPEFLTRKQVAKHFSEFISVKYLANLDSQQKGPRAYRFGGRRVLYDREDFLEWLDGRLVSLTSQ